MSESTSAWNQGFSNVSKGVSEKRSEATDASAEPAKGGAL